LQRDTGRGGNEMARRLLTPAELIRKFEELKAVDSPEILQAMAQAAADVEGTAKKYCTPGNPKYYKAPYSDDRGLQISASMRKQIGGLRPDIIPRTHDRLLVHMRDQISHVVIADGNQIHGIVYVMGSGEGEPWHYALPVHTGTYDYFEDPTVAGDITSRYSGKVTGVKGMPPRPVIPDAVRENAQKTLQTLSKGVEAHLRRVCE